MSKEIERKFLVKNSNYKEGLQGLLYRQGYLSTDPRKVIRVRIVENTAYLTIKGLNHGCTRDEFEYLIPLSDAMALLLLCENPLIEKLRYRIEFEGHLWEVDEFLGENEGLVLAEIELESDTQCFSLPPWISTEVTGDVRYYNNNLIKNPYRLWESGTTPLTQS